MTINFYENVREIYLCSVKSNVRPQKDDIILRDDEKWKVVQCVINYGTNTMKVFCRRETSNDVCYV